MCKLSAFHWKGKVNSVLKKGQSPQYLLALQVKAWARLNIYMGLYAWFFCSR